MRGEHHSPNVADLNTRHILNRKTRESDRLEMQGQLVHVAIIVHSVVYVLEKVAVRGSQGVTGVSFQPECVLIESSIEVH